MTAITGRAWIIMSYMKSYYRLTLCLVAIAVVNDLQSNLQTEAVTKQP